MKKSTLILIFIAFAFNAISQNDTTVVKIDTLSAEDQLFYGNYEPEIAALAPVFCFSKFAVKNSSVKIKPRRFSAHGSGFFAGFSNLATRSLGSIGAVENAELKLSSYEIGLTFIGMDAQLSRNWNRWQTGAWLFFAGLGFKVQQYNADLNYAFVEQDFVTVQQRPEAGIFYSKSKLTQWYLHVPVMFEYQKKLPKKSHFFAQAGFELGLKLSSKSKVVYRDNQNKKIKDKLGKGMNVNPLTADAKVEIGFNDIALYARYGLVDLFRKGRGPEVVPVAAGVIWYF